MEENKIIEKKDYKYRKIIFVLLTIILMTILYTFFSKIVILFLKNNHK